MDNILNSSKQASPDNLIKSEIFNKFSRDMIVDTYLYDGIEYPIVTWKDIVESYPDMWVTLYAPGFDRRNETKAAVIDVFTDEEVDDKMLYYRRKNRQFLCWRTIEYYMGGVWM